MPAEDDEPLTRSTMRGMMYDELNAYFKSKKEDTGIKSIKQIQAEGKRNTDVLVEELAARKRRRKMTQWITGVATAVGTISFGGYKVVIEKEPEAVVEAKDVKETVQAEGKAATERVERVEADLATVEKKVGRLGEIAVDQQIQASDNTEYIGAKIDAAHPRQAAKVPEPEGVKEARKRATDSKRKKRRKELDPFQGLDLGSPPPRPEDEP